MLGIAKLLFGEDVARALEGLTGDDGWRLADQARRAGEWCGSTPRSGGAGHGDRWLGTAGPYPRRPVRREF